MARTDAAPDGTPIMHVDGFVRGKGKFVVTDYVPTDEKTGPRFPLLLTTGPHPVSQYNVGAQTRRTDNVAWHPEDRARNPSVRCRNRGIKRRRLGALPAAQGRRPCARK
jgi:formate dehydrogenase major subunit